MRRFGLQVSGFGFRVSSLVRGGDSTPVLAAGRSLVSASESKKPLLEPEFPEDSLFSSLGVQKIGLFSLYLIESTST